MATECELFEVIQDKLVPLYFYNLSLSHSVPPLRPLCSQRAGTTAASPGHASPPALSQRTPSSSLVALSLGTFSVLLSRAKASNVKWEGPPGNKFNMATGNDHVFYSRCLGT